jgi:hypothetical protein
VDQTTLDSAYLRAKARFDVWRENVEAQWGSLQSKTVSGMLDDKLSKLPENVQSASRKAHPAEWRELDKRQEKKGR